MRRPFVWLYLLVVGSACESEADRLRREGYTNVRAMSPLSACPAENPDLDEAFVADRDGHTFEIKKCCHREMYTYTCKIGEIDDIAIYGSCNGTRTECERYIELLPPERRTRY